MEENKDKISRKKFLQTLGAVVAGGAILGVSGSLLSKRLTGADNKQAAVTDGSSSTASPYKLVSSFSVPEAISAFELAGDKLVVAAGNTILIYSRQGSLLNSFAAGSGLRDIATDQSSIYLLFAARVEVYSSNGEWIRSWDACSSQSDYCSMVVANNAVFVTDVANKNICKYTTNGDFVKFIDSPNQFIIPSYSFGITYTNNAIYCSNPGRHSVESYSLDGDYLGTFGKAGGAAGMFCGCCNPVHLAHTAGGEIITSEKGNPRISCYGSNGEFRSLLLDSRQLGGGTTAYDIKVHQDELLVADNQLISTFRYDKALAATAACSDCNADCPLRKGITI